jgi:hypothetical protein
MSSQSVGTAHFQHALETSAVEIASRRLYLNEHSRSSLGPSLEFLNGCSHGVESTGTTTRAERLPEASSVGTAVANQLLTRSKQTSSQN